MKIVIAEKPSVAKSIARFFGATQSGNGYISGSGVAVTWCFGHLFEQAEPDYYGERYKKWDMDVLPIVPETWKLLPKADAKKQIKIIGDLLATATSIIHAGDPDREGQLLVDEVLEHFKCKAPVKRLWLSALDDDSIEKAIRGMKDGETYRPLKLAAEARARADWMVGMNLTRAWTIQGRKSGYDGVLSVGRVQTPTLALVVKRDLEIENFKARDYFEVEAAFPFPAAWRPDDAVDTDEEGRVLSRAIADTLAAKVRGRSAKVSSYESKKCSQAAPLPHSLSSLQEKASARYGFSAQEVLDIAQALYETHKVTSYPRTDCRYLPESMHVLAGSVLQNMVGEYRAIAAKADASRKSIAFNDSKVTAHHAIIPTCNTPKSLNTAEQKLYDLIVRAYLSQFYPAFEYQQKTIGVICESELFIATGRTTLAEGWKIVYGSDENESEEERATPKLPVVAIGDVLTCSDARVLAKVTKPPNRYTDGTLIAAMTNVFKLVDDPEIKKRLKETAGIGTEATRAGIIETLRRRKFIEKKGKQLISTLPGRNLIAALGNSAVVNVGTTGIFEGYLDSIAQGELNPVHFLANMQANLTVEINKLRGSGGSAQPIIAAATTKPTAAARSSTPAAAVKCPKCGKPMVKRSGVNGPFYGCTGYPDCKGCTQIR